ncbi:MAG: hypothetical protein JJU45_11225 [Acidimicrobiia bacterium]|nr:hypothetical protein [Acidimicrobiia bacterium]
MALAGPVVVMALLVACSQPPGSPVEHRVYEGGYEDFTIRPAPPSFGRVEFTLDWYTGHVRSLTSNADLQRLLEALDARPRGNGEFPALRDGESAVVISAGNPWDQSVELRDVRLVEGDVLVTFDIEEYDREGRCAERWEALVGDVFVVVVAVADLSVERVRLDGNIVECEPPADEEDEIFREV